MGKESFSFATKDCRRAESLRLTEFAPSTLTPSTLIPATRSPLEAKSAWLCWRNRICSMHAGDEVVQKLRSKKVPRNDFRAHVLPAGSGREKSGALNGSISQVSTEIGSGSNFGVSPARV